MRYDMLQDLWNAPDGVVRSIPGRISSVLIAASATPFLLRAYLPCWLRRFALGLLMCRSPTGVGRLRCRPENRVAKLRRKIWPIIGKKLRTERFDSHEEHPIERGL
jgi:hypothetical protein